MSASELEDFTFRIVVVGLAVIVLGWLTVQLIISLMTLARASPGAPGSGFVSCTDG